MSRSRKCSWSCQQCHQQGTARVYVYKGEFMRTAEMRHQRETRLRCVDGCRYVAQRFSSAAAQASAEAQTVGAVDPSAQLSGTPSTRGSESSLLSSADSLPMLKEMLT